MVESIPYPRFALDLFFYHKRIYSFLCQQGFALDLFFYHKRIYSFLCQQGFALDLIFIIKESIRSSVSRDLLWISFLS